MDEAFCVSMSESEKIAAFDLIAEQYYNKNFGSVSKADIDLLMFHVYLESKIRLGKGEDGTIDYQQFSDYKIGKELGITPQKVRNLKIKKELKYPQPEFDWKKSLRRLLAEPNRIMYEKGFYKINIPDPNLYLAIQDYIEDQGGVIEIQLNSKLLQVKEKYLIALLYCVFDEKEKKQIWKAVQECNPEIKKEKQRDRIKMRAFPRGSPRKQTFQKA